MANKQINELTELSLADSTSLLIVYDVNEPGSEKSKKITRDNIMPVFSAWVLVAEYNLSSEAIDETINYDGETNRRIQVITDIDVNSSGAIGMYPNNDTDNNNYDRGNILQNGAVVTSTFSATHPGISTSVGIGKGRTVLEGDLKANNGIRDFIRRSVYYRTDDTDAVLYHSGIRWHDTSNPVTSLRFLGTDSYTGIIQVYKWHTFGT